MAGGAAAHSRRRHRQDVLILAYHNVVPDGALISGDRSLHLPQRDFGRQLDLLQRTHDIVDLSAALESARSVTRSERERPLAAITFDDAYSGSMTAGVAELRLRDLPATFFVAPHFVGGSTFWWDTLAHPETGLAPDVRTTGLELLRGRQDELLAWAGEAGVRSHDVPDHTRCSSIDHIKTALEYEKITLGSHTWSHPSLPSLNPDELSDELSAPRDWLAQFGDRVLPIISYPYGHANSAVSAAARKAGYVAGLMVDGGWTAAGHANALAVPRLNIPAGVSDDGFVIRSAGLLAG